MLLFGNNLVFTPNMSVHTGVIVGSIIIVVGFTVVVFLGFLVFSTTGTVCFTAGFSVVVFSEQPSNSTRKLIPLCHLDGTIRIYWVSIDVSNNCWIGVSLLGGPLKT